MLRSIFSLIQRIIDSDRQYNNTKSRTVIYCLSNPDNSVNMDLRIDGKTRKSVKTIQDENTVEIDSPNIFQLKSDQGDAVTLHATDDKVSKLNENEEIISNDVGDRAIFINTEEISDKIEQSTELDAQPHVHELLKNFPESKIKFIRKDRDQVTMLLEQINKMKAGLQRLHDIAHQFNCSEKFAQDMNYLRANLKQSLKESSSEENDISTKL